MQLSKLKIGEKFTISNSSDVYIKCLFTTDKENTILNLSNNTIYYNDDIDVTPTEIGFLFSCHQPLIERRIKDIDVGTIFLFGSNDYDYDYDYNIPFFMKTMDEKGKYLYVNIFDGSSLLLLDEDISIKLVNILTIKQEKNHDIEQTKKLLHEHMNLFF